MPELDEYADDQAEPVVNRVGGQQEDAAPGDGEDAADSAPGPQGRSGLMDQGQS